MKGCARRALTVAHTMWLEVLRRKDVYVLLILLAVMLLSLVSLNIFGLGGVTRYVADLGLLMVWIFGWVLTVTVTARQLPQEESRGTIFPLLAKPISRAELLAGKWLGSWSIACVAVFVFYLLVTGVVLLKGGVLNGIALMQGCVLHAAALAVIAAIALLLSARMTADAATTLSFVVTGAAMGIVPRIPELAAQSGQVRGGALLVIYHLLPHFEVFDMRRRIVHDFGPAGWGTVATVLAYAAVLTGLFLVLAWLSYRRRRFSREARS